ncbi:PepSY domain-containing protein [Emticicia sp. BO119]|uniref:PepSY-associated TM helix domain-containing protein n=1 Tax=Emticicia sp. BO119 TaxID=2757768 RepID=UPI0015F09AC2|nr:PepSY-associated TM helix domain-containing protein [Emticicia sp. BO119]MBA4852488.1 PepSY domain-containing protein [Emticicia sp. BO119]
MKLNRQLFRIHSWFGLINGFFLILLGLSGSALVFKKEIDDWANKELLTVQQQQKRLPLDYFYEDIAKRYPAIDGIAWINPDDAPDKAFNFRLYLNDARITSYDLGLITYDPFTGRILREGELQNLTPSAIEWIYQYHFSIQVGVPGAAFVGLLGLCIIISIITGFIIYKKHIIQVLTFRIKINRKSWRTITSDLHRIVGVWALFFNIIIAFTGFWLNLFAFEPKVWANEMIPTKPNTLAKHSLDSLFKQALIEMPDLTPQYVYLPTQPNKKFFVRGAVKGEAAIWAGNNSIQFNPQTGELISVNLIADENLWNKIEATFYSLHIGSYGGGLIRVIYVFVGLTPGFLSITGFLLWRRRRKRHKMAIHIKK